LGTIPFGRSLRTVRRKEERKGDREGREKKRDIRGKKRKAEESRRQKERKRDGRERRRRGKREMKEVPLSSHSFVSVSPQARLL
jgi:hypothetical protein